MGLWSAADKISFGNGVWIAVLVDGHVRQELELAARALIVHRFKHPDGACEVGRPSGPVRY